MKISYKHLIENIQSKPDLNTLSEKLFQLGHEHQVFEEVFDLELTPNRGDCLSINGILRDLKLFYEINLNKEIYEKEINQLNINFTNDAPNYCKNISFLKIELNDVSSNYKGDLKNYFCDLDLKKNNFFTDVSNYISYETGQPTHCYDFSKIDNYIKLGFLNKKRKFDPLTGEMIELTQEDLVFFDKDNEVINLAGIMGGKNSSCNLDTKSVLVECAYFDPEIIIGKSLKYNINSDAAHKFERNTDPNCHEYVLKRFLKIVADHADIKSVEIFTDNRLKNSTNNIEFNHNKINKVLGTSISKEDCIRYLSKLGFILTNDKLEIPSYRHDITQINDVSEEIARAIGYDNIDIKGFQLNSNNQNYLDKEEQKLKSHLVNNGFYEVINDPFISVSKDFSVIVDNPLDSQRKYLRTNLKNSLIKNYLDNENRQKDCVKLFEISDVYTVKFNSKKRILGIIASGRVDNNYIDFSKKINNQYIENTLSGFLKNIKLDFETISRESLNSKTKNHISYLEIELSSDFYSELNSNEHIPKKNINDYKYNLVSDFPSSKRDLSFAIKNYSNLNALQELILNFHNKLLKNSFIFDFYNDTNNKEIKIGFRFVFQRDDKTITENEVNLVMEEIIEKSLEFNGISIPGF